MRVAAFWESSCSQTRTDRQPADLSRWSVSASRSRFRSILARHHSALALGQVPCFGQPCQKQPSTNTATLARGKTRSASRRMPATGRRWMKNLMPLRWRTERSCISHSVLCRACADMRRLTAAVDASGISFYTRAAGTSHHIRIGRRRRSGPLEGSQLVLFSAGLCRKVWHLDSASPR
jgi:hypothetical protein